MLSVTNLVLAGGTLIGAIFMAGTVASLKLETQSEISASPEVVWQELTNTAAYPAWNPFIKHVAGELTEGSRPRIQIHPPGGTEMTFTPRIQSSIANTELRWIGNLGLPGVFDGEHYFQIKRTADGGTLLRHGEKFSGALAYILFPLIAKNTLQGFEAMNTALKTRAQARS